MNIFATIACGSILILGIYNLFNRGHEKISFIMMLVLQASMIAADIYKVEYTGTETQSIYDIHFIDGVPIIMSENGLIEVQKFSRKPIGPTNKVLETRKLYFDGTKSYPSYTIKDENNES